MSIEEKNRQDIVEEVKRRFPHHTVRYREEDDSETLYVFVDDQNGRRVHTLPFTSNEWQDYPEHPSVVRAKIAKAFDT